MRALFSCRVGASRGSGSSPAKSYYKDPQESVSQVIFRPKTTKLGFWAVCCMKSLRAIVVAAAKAVQRARISRNKPGV